MAPSFAKALAQLCPNASKTIIAGIVDNAHLLDQTGIKTPIRLRHFFARACVETGGLRGLEENLTRSKRGSRPRTGRRRLPIAEVASSFEPSR